MGLNWWSQGPLILLYIPLEITQASTPLPPESDYQVSQEPWRWGDYTSGIYCHPCHSL